MLSARIGFAVPEKILNRSSSTTLALRVTTQQPHHLSKTGTEKIFHRWMDTKRCCCKIHVTFCRLVSGAHQTSVPAARDTLANEGLIVQKPDNGSGRHPPGW